MKQLRYFHERYATLRNENKQYQTKYETLELQLKNEKLRPIFESDNEIKRLQSSIKELKTQISELITQNTDLKAKVLISENHQNAELKEAFNLIMQRQSQLYTKLNLSK